MKKTKRRRIRLTVRPYTEAVEQIIATAERIEKGLPVAPQEAEINFSDAANLLSTLSEKRMELLMFLHQAGSSTIRQLAK
ncbi:MAG: hypothetical protein IT342_22385, partial [Candidatus Melainabacteria bacterium]|nr:hypothetical protein [Candidatus Melainabacteria bacterium]